MRVKFMKDNAEILSASSLVIDEPRELKGKWHSLLSSDSLALEIGCGAGAFIRQMSQRDTDIGWVGLERIGSVLAKAVLRYNREHADAPVQEAPENLRLICGDANFLSEYFEFGEVDRIYLNFSDPWPKKHHAKRRLTSEHFLNSYLKVLNPDGFLQMKTDNDDLFAFSLESLKECGWTVLEFSDDLHHSDLLPDNIMTEYEIKFSSAGKNIHYLKAIPPRRPIENA